MHGLMREIDYEVKGRHSHLEVICGPMFSGKTEELIRRIRRVQYARLSAIVFKPAIDMRYSDDMVVSHSDHKISSVPVADVAHIRAYLGSAKIRFHVVGLDEVHFFSHEIMELCEELVDSGVRVIAAGLCEDYLGRPFGFMPQLLAHADIVTKLWAICMRCGALASKSQRIRRPGEDIKEEQVVVGASLYYEARCRSCHKKAVVSLSHEERKADVDLVRVHV
ncbi:MAG TPA: thymidine kinase [Myxococcota bacterium]|nr:thymidine kinase [Myxococcota bacterium]